MKQSVRLHGPTRNHLFLHEIIQPICYELPRLDTHVHKLYLKSASASGTTHRSKIGGGSRQDAQQSVMIHHGSRGNANNCSHRHHLNGTRKVRHGIHSTQTDSHANGRNPRSDRSMRPILKHPKLTCAKRTQCTMSIPSSCGP